MGSCEGATLRDHREHHRGMCNSRSCRPLLSLGRKRFQATTTKTTPFERKWKWKEAKERDTAGTGCGRGWSIKTVVFEMGLCLKSPCCPDPCHTATFAGWCVTCTPQTHPVNLSGPRRMDGESMGLLGPGRSVRGFEFVVFNATESSNGRRPPRSKL